MNVRLLLALLLPVMFSVTYFMAMLQDQRRTVEMIDSEQILIVYLSRTENTEAVAEIIQEEVGGKMIELELETPYPGGFFYRWWIGKGWNIPCN